MNNGHAPTDGQNVLPVNAVEEDPSDYGSPTPNTIANQDAFVDPDNLNTEIFATPAPAPQGYPAMPPQTNGLPPQFASDPNGAPINGTPVPNPYLQAQPGFTPMSPNPNQPNPNFPPAQNFPQNPNFGAQTPNLAPNYPQNPNFLQPPNFPPNLAEATPIDQFTPLEPTLIDQVASPQSTPVYASKHEGDLGFDPKTLTDAHGITKSGMNYLQHVINEELEQNVYEAVEHMRDAAFLNIGSSYTNRGEEFSNRLVKEHHERRRKEEAKRHA